MTVVSRLTQGQIPLRERGAVRPAKVEALAPLGDGADEDRLLRPKVVAGIGLRQFLAMVAVDRDEVEDGRRVDG